ncbi:MAG: DUF362 domain-containing protein [Treponemataceae bacterium]|nr:DUF362 domain-containing protein [Treponemataceae bacterium]
MTKNVALQKCAEYDFNKVYDSIKKLMELVPPPDVSGKTVLLKPNILSPKKPEFAVCTHPVVVGAAVKIFVELGAKRVIVGESPATANPTMAAKSTGMYEQIIKNGGEWVEFAGGKQVQCPDGKMVKVLEFADPFIEADVVVSLSKLKTHQLMSYTGSMKNLFGLVVGLKKAQTHYRFPNKADFGTFLTDLNIAANPQYAIMDAIVCMEGEGGPGNGNPVQVGFLGASDNILALDWSCASIVGYNPYQILNLKDAMERKIWLNSPDEIQILGEKAEDVKPASFKIVKEASAATTLQKMLPGWMNSLATLIFVKTPRFNKSKCIKCGRCIEICPAHILSFETESKDSSNGAKFVKMADRKKCLHCFCCHEICPVEAITLRKF